MSRPIKRNSTIIVRYDLSKSGVFKKLADDCDNFHDAGFQLTSTIKHQQQVVAIFQKPVVIKPEE